MPPPTPPPFRIPVRICNIPYRVCTILAGVSGLGFLGTKMFRASFVVGTGASMRPRSATSARKPGSGLLAPGFWGLESYFA